MIMINLELLLTWLQRLLFFWSSDQRDEHLITNINVMYKSFVKIIWIVSYKTPICYQLEWGFDGECANYFILTTYCEIIFTWSSRFFVIFQEYLTIFKWECYSKYSIWLTASLP